MDQSQEILLGHAVFAISEYSYRRIARSISNKKSLLLIERAIRRQLGHSVFAVRQSAIYSFIRSLVCSFIYSFIHSVIHSFIHLFTHL